MSANVKNMFAVVLLVGFATGSTVQAWSLWPSTWFKQPVVTPVEAKPIIPPKKIENMLDLAGKVVKRVAIGAGTVGACALFLKKSPNMWSMLQFLGCDRLANRISSPVTKNLVTGFTGLVVGYQASKLKQEFVDGAAKSIANQIKTQIKAQVLPDPDINLWLKERGGDCAEEASKRTSVTDALDKAVDSGVKNNIHRFNINVIGGGGASSEQVKRLDDHMGTLHAYVKQLDSNVKQLDSKIEKIGCNSNDTALAAKVDRVLEYLDRKPWYQKLGTSLCAMVVKMFNKYRKNNNDPVNIASNTDEPENSNTIVNPVNIQTVDNKAEDKRPNEGNPGSSPVNNNKLVLNVSQQNDNNKPVKE